MAAIDPHLAASDERPGRKMLQARRPIRPTHCRAEGGRRHAKRLLVTEHGNRECGVHRLMTAGQSREREMELALTVAVVKLSLTHDRVPGAAAGKYGRAALIGY